MKILYIENKSDIEELIKSLHSSEKDSDTYYALSLQNVDYIVSNSSLWNSLLNVNANDYLDLGLFKLGKYLNEIIIDNKRVSLSKREYELLKFIVTNSPRLVSVDRIRTVVWREYCGLLSNTIEVHVNRINRKAGKKLIRCVKGFGYKLNIN